MPFRLEETLALMDFQIAPKLKLLFFALVTMDPREYNPWSSDEAEAGLRRALLLAEKSGFVVRGQDEVSR